MMNLPNLHDVFHNLNFSEDCTPETQKADEKIENLLRSLQSEYDIPFNVTNEIDETVSAAQISNQYLGFVQGFKWAVYLFTGHIDNKEGIKA